MSSLRREILRKLAHLSYSLIILGYSVLHTVANDQLALLALTAFLLIFIKLEYIRVELRGFQDLAEAFFRPQERGHFASGTLMIMASIICFAVFPYKIALASLLMMIFGDTVAGLISLLPKSHRIFRRKTFEGTVTELIVNIAIGIVIFPMYPLFGILLAAIATGVELFTQRLPDNLTIPLFTSFFGFIFSTLLPPM